MSDLVCSNEYCRSRSAWTRQLLNVGYYLRLFVNDLTPGPATLLTDFTEATFGGYSAFQTVDAFDLPLKVIDGHYQIQSDVFTWTPTVGNGQIAYGYYVTLDPDWYLALRFAAPITVLSGIPISVRIIFA